jgi:hypothetical protein
VAGSCEHGNQPSGFIKGGGGAEGFVAVLNDFWLLEWAYVLSQFVSVECKFHKHVFASGFTCHCSFTCGKFEQYN